MECCFDGVGWRLFNDVSTRMVGLVVLALAYSDCWLRVWRLLAYSVYYGGVIEEPLIMSQQGWLAWWFEIYLLYSDCAGCGNGLCCFGGVGWHILDSGYCWYTAEGGGDGLWGRFIVICYKKKQQWFITCCLQSYRLYEYWSYLG